MLIIDTMHSLRPCNDKVDNPHLDTYIGVVCDLVWLQERILKSHYVFKKSGLCAQIW